MLSTATVNRPSPLLSKITITPTIQITLAVLVPLTAFGTVEAILHLKKYFGRTLRKLIGVVDGIVPTKEEISELLVKNPIPLEQVEQHIAEKETQPVVEGAERQIRWHNPAAKTKTPVCVVFLHGWSACAQEGRPVVGRIAKHLQANSYCDRLPGHGRQREAQPGWSGTAITRGPPCGKALLKEAQPRELFLSALDALRVGLTLGDRVVLVGVSTGAALATWLASLLLEENPNALDEEGNLQPGTVEALGDRLAGLVLISPAYALAHPLYPVLKHTFAALRVLPGFVSHAARTRLIATAIGTPHRNIPATNDDHHRFSTLQYPSAALLHLLDVLYELEIVNHAAITIPTLMIGNPQDPVVNFRVKATNTFLKFGDCPNKILYCLTRGEHQHCVSTDYQSPSTVDEVTEVMRLFVDLNGISPAASRPPSSQHLLGGKQYMMELELERTNDGIDENPMTRRSSHSKGLGTFASYPSLGDLTRPVEF